MDSEEEQIEQRRRRVDLLLAGYWVAAAVVGLVLGVALWALTPLGLPGLVVGVVVVLGPAGWVLTRSERWLVDACGGVAVGEREQPRLVNMVEGLCTTSGVAMPDLRVVDSPATNLLAVGRHRERTVLVATSGLVEQSNRVELEAVLANEISQIRTLDVAHATTAATILGLPVLLADIGARLRAGQAVDGGSGSVLGRLGGIAALAAVPFVGVSRRALAAELEPHRDFRTDATGVRLTRYPPGLITALERLDGVASDALTVPSVSTPLWIIDPAPTSGRPTVAARVAALREL
jgi:heat shock protein HtpX